MSNPVHATTFIDSVASNPLDYTLLLLAIGIFSMAFIELLKGLTYIRRRFHQHEMEKWISDPICRRELIVLATGGEQYADVLFEQPIERMMMQIRFATDIALEYPYRYRHVYKYFSKADWQIKIAQYGDQQNDSEVWVNYASNPELKAAASNEHAAQQARARLHNLIARRLNTFKNRVQHRWSRNNQIVSIFTGAALSTYALYSTTSVGDFKDGLALFGYALLAGMLAPVAKNVVSAINGMRNKA